MPPEPTIAELRRAARADLDAPEARLVRFDALERTLHWVNATLFGVLMATGAVLYAGPLSTLVGHRVVVRTIHVWAGLALPLPVVLALTNRRAGALRADLARLNRWTRDDARWFRRRFRHRVRLGKFNPGQKLNAAFVAGAGIVMLATGSVMHWFDHFTVNTRTGATFVHDWFAIAIWVTVSGHVLFALRDPEAFGAMRRGDVSARWARTHAPLWYEELRHSR